MDEFIPLVRLTDNEREVVFVRPSKIEKLIPVYVREPPSGTNENPIPIPPNLLWCFEARGEIADVHQLCWCNDKGAKVLIVRVTLFQDDEKYNMDPVIAEEVVGRALTNLVNFFPKLETPQMGFKGTAKQEM